MAKKEDTPFLGGFDILSDALHGQPGQEEGRMDQQSAGGDDAVEDLDDEKFIKDQRTHKDDTPGIKTVNPDFFEKENEKDEEGDEADEEKEEVDEREEDELEEDEVDEEEDDSTEDDKEDGKDDSLDDPKEFEQSITSFMKEQLSDSLGWDFSKMEEEPNTVEGLVEFMRDLVAENSVPDYANEEVKAYDDFVRNGGNLRDFYKNVIENRIDPDKLDIEEESDQKSVIRQNLRNQGLSDSLIEKRLKRYDEAGVLFEEAEEALELVKEYDEKQRKKLLEDQQKQAQLIEKQQQKFVSDVQKNINELSDIKGLKISEKEKKELRDYILVADADGMTKYQRDYMSDINNLLESAYFTKNKDALLDRARKQGSSTSLRDLQKKLSQNKGNRGKSGSSRGRASVDLGDLGSRLGL